MTYTTPTWTQYFNEIITSPLAHSIFVGVLIVAAMILVLAVARKLSNGATSTKPQLSRGARKSLEKSGYKVERTRDNGYKVAKPRTIASYR